MTMHCDVRNVILYISVAPGVFSFGFSLFFFNQKIIHACVSEEFV